MLPSTLSKLREQVQAVAVGERTTRTVRLGFGAELRLGALHEIFDTADAQNRRAWSPPLCVLAGMASSAVHGRAVRHVVWVGRSCWPYPLFLDQQRALLSASVLIDPLDDACRVWVIDQVLRSASPAVVIADGEGLTLPQTRRLQLAAGTSGALCLLARPSWERSELSAATTRWSVTREPSLTDRPRWRVALLRNKDQPVCTDDLPTWSLEWDDAQSLVRVPAPVAGGTGYATAGVV